MVRRLKAYVTEYYTVFGVDYNYRLVWGGDDGMHIYDYEVQSKERKRSTNKKII